MSHVRVLVSLAVEDCCSDILATCFNVCNNYAEITKGFVLVGAIDHRIKVFSAFFANYVLSRVGSGCWRGLDVAF